MSKTNIFIITGTDTGVGKTVFTGLLGRYLIDKGVSVTLSKPFCSGGREDIKFLENCSGICLADLNYWYENDPISPAASELRSGSNVDFEGCLSWLKNVEDDILLIEGVGGVLAPLTREGRTIASVGQELSSQFFVVAPNRVGVVNHVLMTAEAALNRGLSISCVVLMNQEVPDDSSIDNDQLIRINFPEMVDFKGVFKFPWLGVGADAPAFIAVNLEKAKGVLGEIFEECVLPSLERDASVD